MAAVPRRRDVHGLQGIYVKREEAIRSFKQVVDGNYDHLPKAAFMYVGTIEDAVEKAKQMGAKT